MSERGRQSGGGAATLFVASPAMCGSYNFRGKNVVPFVLICIISRFGKTVSKKSCTAHDYTSFTPQRASEPRNVEVRSAGQPASADTSSTRVKQDCLYVERVQRRATRQRRQVMSVVNPPWESQKEFECSILFRGTDGFISSKSTFTF